MEANKFVHLHLHTEYSLLDGACRIDRMFRRAKELGQDAVAITDHGVLYGVIPFYKAATAAGIRPIIGCEVYLAPRKMTDKDPAADREYYHLVLLCENMTGYKNLMQLVTKSFTEGFYQKPRIDRESLIRYHEGLIALSACLAGKIPRLISLGLMDDAIAEAKDMQAIFGEGNFFLEVQDHGIPDQLRVNAALFSISAQTGIPTVATNDVHYLNRTDAKSHDVLICIQTGKTLQDPDRMKFETEEFYLKSAEEMLSLFPSHPEAIENTLAIADRCRLQFDFSDAHLPEFHNELGLSSPDYLRLLCRQGLDKKLSENGVKNREPYEERLQYELEIVEKMGFCDYFLIVADFVQFAKKSGIYVGPGRGSGAGSLAAWCLGITELDPLRHHLFFERFLNPERISMPDFDIDFCMERRGEVIRYVSEKYGADHLSQIITFTTLAARAAVRDVGRALGMPYADVDRIAKRIPKFIGMTLEEALASDEELARLCQTGQYKDLMTIALALEGMPRNASVHAAGVLLTDQPVTEYVPLAINSGTVVTQYTMNELADLGLLKIDFLGIRYLTIMRDAIEMIRRHDPDFCLETVPEDDEQTYQMISRGETSGLFQIESSGMKSLMLQLKPRCLDDITAAIALFRPGPKDSIPRFLECRRKNEPVRRFAEIDPILEDTYGCIVYQEQVMEIFRKVAGYSLGRADLVRRAISKKKAEILQKERHAFLYGDTAEDGRVLCEGAIARGIPEKVAEALFAEMSDFADYAFNKSHAAAYALFSYRTAYLKCKYPKEYMAALLSNQMRNDKGDKYAYYFFECQKMGISILPPDINESDHSFSVVGDNLRYGLVGVKNVGEGLIAAIFRERREKPFSSFGDFVRRLRSSGLNKRALESLVLAGAFDSFGIARSRLFSAVDSFLESSRSGIGQAMPGQMSLFDALPEIRPEEETEEYPEIAEFSLAERLKAEKSVCGVYLSGHPMKEYLPLSRALHAEELLSFQTEAERFLDGDRVLVLCQLDQITLKQIRSGDKMAFIQGEDTTGRCEIIVFPKVLKQYGTLLETGRIVAVIGSVNSKDEEIKLLAERFLTPDQAKAEGPLTAKRAYNAAAEEKKTVFQEKSAKVSKIFLRFREKGSKIEDRVSALLRTVRGETPCFYYYESTKEYVESGQTVQWTPRVYQELCALLGEDNVKTK